MASAMHSAGRGNALDKVKSMISDMISKLQDAAEADATKNAYCQKELGETNVKKEDKTDDVEEATTKLEQGSAKSAKLKDEVATLQQELSKLTKAQSEMDKMRSTEKATYEETKAKGDKGLNGCQMAIKVLKDYYAKGDSPSSAADSIIALLEHAESKMTAWLADLTSDEETAAAEYKSMTEENEIDKATKEADVKHKTKEAKALDKTISELSTDKEGMQVELNAVTEYMSKIEAECVAKPETFEERKKRRDEELAGLKEALDLLGSGTSLIQRRALRKKLRGSEKLMAASLLFGLVSVW